MARKKKSEELVAVPEVAHEPTMPEGKYLTSEEMLKMRLYEEEAIAGDSQAQLLIYQKDAYLVKIDPQGRLGTLIQGIQDATKKNIAAKTKAKELKAQIEERLGIKLDEYAYNEETGLLQKPEQ